MANLNGKGPDNKGSQTGRKLGRCTSATQESLLDELGKGLGMRRKCGGGSGKGRRLKQGKSV